MKGIVFVLILVLSSVTSQAQNDSNECYEQTIECELSKNSLWINLQQWIANNFNSYKHTVETQDKDNGLLILKFNDKNTLGVYTDVTLSAILQVNIKDRKIRYRISSFTYKISPNSMCDNMQRLSNKTLDKIQLELKSVANFASDNTKKYLENQIKYYTEKLNNTPKYKKPKDESRNKVNSDYELIEKTLELANMVDTKFSILNVEVGGSIEKAMLIKDDF